MSWQLVPLVVRSSQGNPVEIGDLIVEREDGRPLRVPPVGADLGRDPPGRDRRIFNRWWLYVGHESEVRSGGTSSAARSADGRCSSCVAVKTGDVNVFHNSCTHRGADDLPRRDAATARPSSASTTPGRSTATDSSSGCRTRMLRPMVRPVGARARRGAAGRVVPGVHLRQLRPRRRAARRLPRRRPRVPRLDDGRSASHPFAASVLNGSSGRRLVGPACRSCAEPTSTASRRTGSCSSRTASTGITSGRPTTRTSSSSGTRRSTCRRARDRCGCSATATP